MNHISIIILIKHTDGKYLDIFRALAVISKCMIPILQKAIADWILKKMVLHHRELRNSALECLNNAFGQVA